ncbi:hypothetical protein [Nitrogeniibacter aestuarii]|uniref:hypothetical protein n=1 Tax=Nitrogeniibacter aestuarii TaxID=2815343 RepID=UPI001D12946A|nr:hypothetical protein [Nitrogeniibacter aestuarii]
MSTLKLIRERSATLIAGVYNSAPIAGHVAGMIGQSRPKWQVDVVAPGDIDMNRKLVPENSRVWQTFKRTHKVLGAFGLIGGLAIGLVLTLTNAAVFASSPEMTLIAFGLYGLFGGLLVAGATALRPDRDLAAMRISDAAAEHKWTVVAHARDEREADYLSDVMAQSGGRVIRSL